MRLHYRPKETERCTGCGRLGLKAKMRDGPEGGRYGRQCYERAVAASLIDPFAQAREGTSTRDEVDADVASETLPHKGGVDDSKVDGEDDRRS